MLNALLKFNDQINDQIVRHGHAAIPGVIRDGPAGDLRRVDQPHQQGHERLIPLAHIRQDDQAVDVSRQRLAGGLEDQVGECGFTLDGLGLDWVQGWGGSVSGGR